MRLYRKDDWAAQLQEYVASVSDRPFQPGKHDCALFTAGAVEAMTGINLAHEFGNYRTLRGGLSKLKSAGFSDHVDFVASMFEEVIGVGFLAPGDIAVMDGQIDQSLSVVQGAGIYVLQPTGGIGIVPLERAIRGFRVPFKSELK